MSWLVAIKSSRSNPIFRFPNEADAMSFAAKLEAKGLDWAIAEE